MQEGESELGGLKIPHGNTTPPSSTPGPQPDSSAASISEPTSPVVLNSEPHSALGSQPDSSTPLVDPTPSQPSQPLTPPSVQAPPQPFQQFQSQQFQSPQPLQPSPQPLSPSSFPPRANPVPTNPFANTTSTNPFPNTPASPTAIFPNTSDIVLSEPKSKSKIKKWTMIIITSIVAVVILIFGVAILSGNNPFRPEATKEKYEELNTEYIENYSNIYAFYNLIDIGLYNELSFYELFMPRKDIGDKMSVLFNGNLPSSYTPILPQLLNDNQTDLISASDFVQHINDFSNYLDNLRQQKVTSDLRQSSVEIQDMLPHYSEISETFLSKINALQTNFNNIDIMAIEKFTNDYDFSSDVKDRLVDYTQEYQQILSVWDQYQSNPTGPSSEFYDSLSPDILYAMEEDTYTVSDIFEKLISTEEIDFLKEFNNKLFDFESKFYMILGDYTE